MPIPVPMLLRLRHSFFGEDTTESHKPVDIFKNPINHATAAASILVFAAKQTGFRPSEKSAESLAKSVDAFERKISTFPGFTRNDDITVYLQLEDHTTVEEFRQAIRDLLEWVSHIDKIAFKFAELLPLNLEPERNSLEKWILSLIVLDKPEDSNDVRIQLAHITLNIAFDKTTAFIPNQEARVFFSDFQLDPSVLYANADRLAENISIVDVEDTIAFFAPLDSEADRLFARISQRALSFQDS